MTHNILIAGFGGQGVLFAGKVLAYGGLCDGKEISWLPSYGPEMRGGTCNCSVCVSDQPIGSPLVTNPDILVAMNRPSLEKFIDAVVPGGTVIIDSSIVDVKIDRSDITVCKLPATELAEQNDLKGLGNMVLVGRLNQVCKVLSAEGLDKGLVKCVPARKPEMVDFNRKAIEIGKA
ncbi:MAG TPA: 2-oxoacid:acceptor oxidoreductase family protein [Oscillospiraceae bacterium]|nr:2-oxoacid:acceptor oxidoreductase family protein [Oscillospiraceae bacterium]HPF55506.1 2-oxoacid:acceptor oxidoreductase family protein [Clostridiales bacterium]HPK34772.1 2-oxoacid:acceptor oxidoreductase family protein [Oscillospiraceae bacterium]HPR76128.1 2-oxoacid:acceptor oxidoreductase family protein [Oscillospiraceae bacterium]